jgi:FAD:protein FMN transferase
MVITPLNKEKIPMIKQFYTLGTIIQLKVYGDNDEKAIDEAIAKLNEIDDKMSVFKDYSEVSNINKSAGISPCKVSEDTYLVIKKAVEYSKLYDGVFDPTIRPIVSLWGINTKNSKIPEASEIKSDIKLINYKDIILNDKVRSIKLKYKNQAIDLGGIAKGFAADEVKNILIKNKIENAIIDLGGNIYVLGNKTDGALWNVGIQDPLKARGEYVGIVSAADKSIVTSGNYERYFMNEGKRYHHIIDPSTGYPSENGVISVTVISDYSINGDALTTCAYVMGLDKGLKLIGSIKGTDAIFITEDKKIYATPGIKDTFKLTNEEYTYENSIN